MIASAERSPAVEDSSPASFAGHLHLEAARDRSGRTALVRQSFRAPFHLGKPYWDGGVLQVQIVNSTAGILAGDELDLAIRVRSGAALAVTTPAAARAFVMRQRGARCEQTFAVESGGWLEYSPEPLCPHRECDYTQATRLDIAAGGEMFFVDTLAPGRVGRGEAWAWRRLRLGLEVAVDGELVLRERIDGPGADFARAAEFFRTAHAWCVTAVAITSRLDDHPETWDRVRACSTARTRWLGITRLRRGGWILRALLPDGQAVREMIHELRSILAARLPPLRTDLRKL